MALVSICKLLQDARSGGHAIGYFESWNLESLKAVINAAEEANSPVVIGFNGGILADANRILKPENLEYYGVMGRIAAENAGVPAALILNEIHDFHNVDAGIRCGFNAVMFEGKADSLDKSISLTKRIVEKAHASGVAVESYVGALPTAEQGGFQQRGRAHPMTAPEDAKRFAGETGVDVLAVSIGNIEGLTEGKAALDFQLLEKIHRAVNVPLTLHGGSGIADEDVGKLVESGVCKINLGAALNQAFLDGMNNVLKSNTQYVSPKVIIGSGLKEDIMAGGEISVKELVKDKMRVYGSAGKAPRR